MPNKITRWPRGSDPRRGNHLSLCSNRPGCGPAAFLVTAPGATGLLSPLVHGYSAQMYGSFPDFVHFLPSPHGPTLPFNIDVQVNVNNYAAGGPLPVVCRWAVFIETLHNIYLGELFDNDPDLLIGSRFVPMHRIVGPGPDEITGNVKLVPKPWDFEWP